MKRTSFSTWACVLGALGLFIGGACGGTGSGETSGGGASGATAGTAAGGAGGAGGSGAGTIGGCEPACTAPQVCSAAGVCIDEGTCAADGDCMPGTICDLTTKACVPGGACGAQEAKVDNAPPNLLVVLDRSCSMTEAVGASNKWKIAVAAINKMTEAYKGKIRFGLGLFPDTVAPNCGQDKMVIPVGPDNETPIQTLLTAALKTADPYYPDNPCVTNIDTAMTQAATEPAFMDADRDSYALLISDGKQSAGCDPNGNADVMTEATIKNLYEVQGVPTFVLGFGSGIDPAQMNKFAVAGGVPKDGANKYYNAANQDSLDMALAAIAQKTLSCAYTLDKKPASASEIYVFFDNVTTPVPRDVTHMDGWDYDSAANQVVFYGPACDSLKTGVIKDLDIVLGCSEPTPN
ncbi:vWA domain-containing protein [Polyangium aurulentum]|uniref:vWA domain-containing protein n=1 Tax=Polyangium aurulentum TaxID=2567896 RepID=UPI0010AEC47B|nr:VWA domain-containing protein [Polyangium aurulentum]UQA54621.1 VWA domain-containing protein [Polyangium aurulentum]